MNKQTSRNSAITITHLPLVRCQICDRTIAYRKGEAGQVLTAHYSREHSDLLGDDTD